MTMIASKSTMSSVISHASDILPAAAADHNPSKPAPLKPLMSNKSTANRFTAAQRDRTLRHHKLLQPTSSQEKLHLSRLRAERQIEHRCSSSVSLLTLPEEEDEQLQDHVQLVYKRAYSIDEDRVVQEMCYSFKSSLSTATASTTSMSDSQRSISDEDDSDHEEDEYIVSSPFPSQLKSSHSICQPCEMYPHSHSHRFVVCADTQFGIIRGNTDWDAEIQYSNRAIDLINEMEPRPAFVCVCGDLVDMEFSLERKKGCKSKFPSSLFNGEAGIASREVCDAIQDEQNEDFKRIWSRIHPDIALVCLCGNHDVGNRPTPRSISRFRAAYGDEYLGFWVNGTYNIVINNVLFVDPSHSMRVFKTQLSWLEDRLRYAQDHQAKQVYVYSHHPWFLYDEEEDPESLTGSSPCPEEWKTSSNAAIDQTFPDSYFSMPKKYRSQALELFKKYNVDACFSGHFHQNLISKTRWGMDMIITGPLSVVFDSSGKKLDKEQEKPLPPRRKMTFESEEAMFQSSPSPVEEEEPNCRGIRVVDVQVNGSPTSSSFKHFFVPL